MLFAGVLAAAIIILIIIVSPYIMKFVFKLKSFKGIGSGICCMVLCIIILLVCFGLWSFLIIRHMNNLGYKSVQIG